MTPHIVSWSDNEICISPVLSSAASIVSFDPTFSDTYSSHSQMSPTASKTPGLHIADIGAKHKTLLGRKIPGGGHAIPDDSFIRHDAYFFKDGNVTFLVGGMLYCVHRYFFSRDSVYFSTRFAQLGIQDHEALPTIISIGDIECKDFEALLSILYPTNFEAHELTYEQWKSVLHLSTRWGFTSLRKLSLKSITPPTPHDQFVLARIYSIDHWVLPALTALCERSRPLCLDEAQQMSMEDVVLVARVREEIRGGSLRVNAADIRRHIEVVQAGKPSHPVGNNIHWDASKNEDTAQNSDSMVASGVDPNVEEEISETMGVALPSGPRHRSAKEGDTDESDVGRSSTEVPVKSPQVEQPHVIEGTPQDCLKESVAKPVMQTRRTRKSEYVSPEAIPLAVAGTVLTESFAVGAMARQEAEEKANAETMYRLEAADAAKERADAEEQARKRQEEAIRAKERAYAEKKAKREADVRAEAEAAAKAKEEAEVKAMEEAKAAVAKAELGTKQIPPLKEKLEMEAKIKAEAAEAEEEKRRVEAESAESHAKRAEEQIARQRAADKVARAAASGIMAPARGSNGGGWLSKTSQAALEEVWGIPTEEPAPSPTSTSLWNSDPWSKRHVKNASPPSTLRVSAPTRSTTPITAAPSSAGVVSSSSALVWQVQKPTNDRQDAGDTKCNQAIAALPAGAAANVPNGAKCETTMAITDKPVPSQPTNARKTFDIAVGTAAPNALGDKCASPAPTLCTYRSMRTQEMAPAKVAADLKPCKELTSAPPPKPCQPNLLPGSLPLPTSCQPGLIPGGFPPSTPLQPSIVPGNFPPRTPCPSHPFLSRTPPETDVTVTKEHAPSPESVASASAERNGEPESPNVPDAKNAGETSAQTTGSFAAAQDSGVKPDGTAAEPILKPSQHSEAGVWGPAITKGGDANLEGPMKPPLRLDYIREVNTASTMSGSGPGTPTDDARSSSLDKDNDFDAPGGKLTKNQMKRLRERARKQQRQKGEKSGPCPPSGATSDSIGNSVVQEPKPIATAPIDTYSYRGEKCPCGCGVIY